MCRFIETIRIEGGKVWNLSYHNARMNTTRKRVWGNCPALSLEDILKPEPWQERTRCRVVYGENIEEVVYIPYTIRQVSSLKLVPCDDIAYELKSADRSMLNKLFALRGEKDDILIVKNGRITDTSIANVTLSKILCKWKQDSVVSLFLYLNSVFKHKHKLIHNQAPV